MDDKLLIFIVLFGLAACFFPSLLGILAGAAAYGVLIVIVTLIVKIITRGL